MDEIAALLVRMKELEPEVYVYGPAAEDTIRQLEAAFGHPMPLSYRMFLARFGAFSILDRTYSGIIDGKIEQGRGWTLTDTSRPASGVSCRPTTSLCTDKADCASTSVD